MSWSALRGFAGGDSGVELGGFFAGDGDGGPLAGLGGKMLCEEDNLAGVVGIVSDLAIDRLHDGVWFGADRYRARDLRVTQWFERVEDILPAPLP